MTTSLTTGPVAGHLRRQAAPMGLGLVAIFSFEAVDLFFISQLGDAPLAAVAFTFPVIWLLVGIGIGFEAGASSCVSRAVGGGDEQQARREASDAGQRPRQPDLGFPDARFLHERDHQNDAQQNIGREVCHDRSSSISRTNLLPK